MGAEGDERARLALARLRHANLANLDQAINGVVKDAINGPDPQATRAANTVLRAKYEDLEEDVRGLAKKD